MKAAGFIVSVGMLCALSVAGCSTDSGTAQPTTTTARGGSWGSGTPVTELPGAGGPTIAPDQSPPVIIAPTTPGPRPTGAGAPSSAPASTVPRPPVATDVVSLVAVDAAGRPADGFALTGPTPVGTLDCSYMSPSRSATTAGIYECGASADSANVCWAAPDRASLLCANDPWQRGLRLYTVSPPVADIGKTASPEPWALELADGRHCRIRVGGAWGGRSDGLVGAYSCDGGNDVVLQPSTARTAIDTSTSTWLVEVGPLGSGAPDFPAPATVAVRTAYFAATS
ncbi:hypothetical protein [Nocardia salmonicida]